MTSKNTATWVDEKYSKLLGRQLFSHVQGAASDGIIELAKMRASQIYLCEEPIKIGYGVGKPGVKVYYIDNSLYSDTLFIATLYYLKGRMVMKKQYIETELFKITKHAYQRMFERLRTNAKDDVLSVIKHLLSVPPPEVYCQEVEIIVPEIGKFHAVSDRASMAAINKPVWVLKTFIATKRK